MIRAKWLASILVLIPLLSLWGCKKEPLAKLGDVAQDFSLPTLEGEKITLSHFRGKNVFLLFWTQGCVFCQTRSIILLNDIYLKGQQKDLVVFAINVAESKGEVAKFIRQKGLVFPVLMDRDASVTRKKFGVYVVPTLFMIDKEGVIKEKIYGHLDEQALFKFVEPYLKGRPIPPPASANGPFPPQ